MNKLTISTRQLLKCTKVLCARLRASTVLIDGVRNIGTRHPQRAIEKAKEHNSVVSAHFDFHGKWPDVEQHNFIKDMRLVTNFITEEEEAKLLEEIEPYMQRLHYEYDHWDDAIHGFRETERKHWYPHNRSVLERIRQVAFDGEIMPYIHILDLAAEGVIKPHVDSTRYCGTTIAGISLLSDSVMRLVRVDEKKYKQPKENDVESVGDTTTVPAIEDAYRNQPITTLENNFYADVLLQRRSLYIMSHSSRYNFTHEILSNKVAQFRGAPVKKDRRISIICRNEP